MSGNGFANHLNSVPAFLMRATGIGLAKQRIDIHERFRFGYGFGKPDPEVKAKSCYSHHRITIVCEMAIQTGLECRH